MENVFDIFQGNNNQDNNRISQLPDAPPWRDCGKRSTKGEKYLTDDDEKTLVNAALYLRRPLLVTGKPGTGKSSLAYAVAYELKLGEGVYGSSGGGNKIDMALRKSYPKWSKLLRNLKCHTKMKKL